MMGPGPALAPGECSVDRSSQCSNHTLLVKTQLSPELTRQPGWGTASADSHPSIPTFTWFPPTLGETHMHTSVSDSWKA